VSPSEPSTRRDVVRNRAAILRAAAELFAETDSLTVIDIAERAGVSRATVYRHFASVSALLEEALHAASPAADEAVRRTTRGSPDITDVLGDVPPHLLLEQIVSEAERVAGMRSVALYLVDIDGSRLLRAAGSAGLPDEIVIPLAVGPEIPPEGVAPLREAVLERLPNVTVAPIEVRGRALGALLATDVPDGGAALAALSRHAGIALTVGERFTDVIAVARRRRETTPAAETQQLLLAPRVVRLAGLDLAANVIPGYENGGNWFDHAENGDGAWIAAVDTMGSGPRAAAISAVALGALRARRHAGSTPVDAVRAIDRCLQEIGLPDARCALFVARWHGPTSTLFYVAAGGMAALRVSADGGVEPLAGARPELVGGGVVPTVTEHLRLRRGDRLALVSDAISGPSTAALSDGDLERILSRTVGATPAWTLQAIERAVRKVVDGGLSDDAMTMVVAPSGRGAN
jgi:serine phosphatase RsbU (regulator of sigma subunit)